MAVLTANQLADRDYQLVDPFVGLAHPFVGLAHTLVGLAHPAVGFLELLGHAIEALAGFPRKIRDQLLQGQLILGQDLNHLFQAIDTRS